LTLETGDEPEPTWLDTQKSSESEVKEETNLGETDLHDQTQTHRKRIQTDSDIDSITPITPKSVYRLHNYTEIAGR